MGKGETDKEKSMKSDCGRGMLFSCLVGRMLFVSLFWVLIPLVTVQGGKMGSEGRENTCSLERPERSVW